jgi:hypothetical protein
LLVQPLAAFAKVPPLRTQAAAVPRLGGPKKINALEPIVPNHSLGGLCLRTHLSDIAVLIRGLGVTSPGSYEIASAFEARDSFGDGSVQAAVHVRNGRVFKRIATESYQARFGAIHLGMLVRDAMLADPRLYYRESEECVLYRGVSRITLNVSVIDPDPSRVPALRITDITVYAVETETLEGHDGHW